MISKEDTKKRLISIFNDIGIYLDNNSLNRKIEMDSLQFICLIIGIENNFQIDVGDEFYYYNGYSTLSKYIDYVYNHLNKIGNDGRNYD